MNPYLDYSRFIYLFITLKKLVEEGLFKKAQYRRRLNRSCYCYRNVYFVKIKKALYSYKIRLSRFIFINFFFSFVFGFQLDFRFFLHLFLSKRNTSVKSLTEAFWFDQVRGKLIRLRRVARPKSSLKSFIESIYSTFLFISI